MVPQYFCNRKSNLFILEMLVVNPWNLKLKKCAQVYFVDIFIITTVFCSRLIVSTMILDYLCCLKSQDVIKNNKA